MLKNKSRANGWPCRSESLFLSGNMEERDFIPVLYTQAGTTLTLLDISCEVINSIVYYYKGHFKIFISFYFKMPDA